MSRRSSYFYPFLIAFLIFIFIKLFIFDIYIVREESMVPGIKPGTVVLVFKAAYGLHNPFGEGYLLQYNTPSRNHIVIFKRTNESKTFIKRVTATQHQKVTRSNGTLLINGAPESPFFKKRGKDNSILRESWKIPSDHIFVTGDNRTISRDSRTFGPIKTKHVLGRVFFKLLPFSQFGTVQ